MRDRDAWDAEAVWAGAGAASPAPGSRRRAGRRLTDPGLWLFENRAVRPAAARRWRWRAAPPMAYMILVLVETTWKKIWPRTRGTGWPAFGPLA